MMTLFMKSLAILHLVKIVTTSPDGIVDNYVMGIAVPAVKITAALMAAAFLSYAVRRTLAAYSQEGIQ